LVSVLGVSAFWAKARPVAAMAATRKAKILFMGQVLSGVGGGLFRARSGLTAAIV
jgi:hypothetical protein